MQRRKFSREFKLEAVRLVRERGVSVAQAARDLDVHENVLRKWVKEFATEAHHTLGSHASLPAKFKLQTRRQVHSLKPRIASLMRAIPLRKEV